MECRVAFREVGKNVTTFVVFVPPCFDALEELKDNGKFDDILVGAADATFEVEWQGHTPLRSYANSKH